MKEDRIYCTEVSGECQHFIDTTSPLRACICECLPGFYCNKDIAWKPITENACKNCKEGRYQGLTREQTIYKIAKAICKTDRGGCEDCGFKGNEKGCKAYLENGNYITQAEAALEELLEANNGK